MDGGEEKRRTGARKAGTPPRLHRGGLFGNVTAAISCFGS